jgi:hypothetical protein
MSDIKQGYRKGRKGTHDSEYLLEVKELFIGEARLDAFLPSWRQRR